MSSWFKIYVSSSHIEADTNNSEENQKNQLAKVIQVRLVYIFLEIF